LIIVALVGIIAIEIMVICFPSPFARKVPLNYIMLSLFTLLFSYFASALCIFTVWSPEGKLIQGG